MEVFFPPSYFFDNTVQFLFATQVGSRVACLSMDGAWSEFTCLPAANCYVMPDSMSFEEGVALLVQYLTAYFMLFHCANLGKRKSVLIHMAAGGVVSIQQ